MNLRILFFIFISSSCLMSQRAFDAAVVAGLTASQLGGDSLSGYDKLGLTAGLKLSYDIDDKFDVNMELLYVQKGSRPSVGFSTGGDDATTLNYVELPVYGQINDWYVEKEDYHKVGAFVGLSYAYLIAVGTSNNILAGQEGDFKTHDISGRIGIYYSFTKRLTFRTFYTDSFVNVLDSDTLFRTNALDSFNWTFRIEYNL